MFNIHQERLTDGKKEGMNSDTLATRVFPIAKGQLSPVFKLVNVSHKSKVPVYRGITPSSTLTLTFPLVTVSSAVVGGRWEEREGGREGGRDVLVTCIAMGVTCYTSNGCGSLC